MSGNAAIGVHVTALHTEVNILSTEAANDRIVINGLGGRDVIDATNLAADGMQLTMNGGLGNDVFLGSQGGDLINGGDGNDVASWPQARPFVLTGRRRHCMRRPARLRHHAVQRAMSPKIGHLANGSRARSRGYRHCHHGPRRTDPSTSTPGGADTSSSSRRGTDFARSTSPGGRRRLPVTARPHDLINATNGDDVLLSPTTATRRHVLAWPASEHHRFEASTTGHHQRARRGRVIKRPGLAPSVSSYRRRGAGKTSSSGAPATTPLAATRRRIVVAPHRRDDGGPGGRRRDPSLVATAFSLQRRPTLRLTGHSGFRWWNRRRSIDRKACCL